MLAVAATLALTFAQEQGSRDLRGEIALPRAECLTISPTGDLWLGSGDGRLLVSRDRQESWSEVATPAEKPGRFGGGDELEHIAFFDGERAVIAGSIGDRGGNQVLRTEDGGKTWSPVPLPIDTSAFDLQVWADGHAWIAGSTGKLLASEDFGATWRVAGAPFDALRRARSVFFASPEIGVVGASRNGLRLTRDGGQTWTDVTTPADALFPPAEEQPDRVGGILVTGEDGKPELRDPPPGHQDSVAGVWILGGVLLALQRQQLFSRSLDLDGTWTPVTLDGRKLVAGSEVEGGWIGVTEDRLVVRLAEDLQAEPLSAEPLDEIPLDLDLDGRGAVLLMRGGKVCLLEQGHVRCGSLHTVGPERSWPISEFDRARDGTLFGTSSTALYRSTDSARTWERLAEMDRLKDVCCSADAGAAVVATKAGLYRWTEGSAELVSVLPCGEDERELSIQARKGSLWIGASFATDGSSKADRMQRTSDTVLVGSCFTALIYASIDEGKSWKRIDECPGAIVHALWLGSDNAVTLCLSNHVIRAGRIDLATGAAEGDGFHDLTSNTKALGGQWASWIAFPVPDEGLAGGNLYFQGPVLHRTSDGGRTWSRIEDPEDAVMETYRLGSGACVRVAGFWDEASRVDLWHDGAFQELRAFSSGANDARVDADGRLLLRLSDGMVWSLSAEASEWTNIGRIAIPR